MPDNSHLRVIASLITEGQGLYLAGMAVLSGLIDQGTVNRERLIDYLLQVRADLSVDERRSEYGLWLQVLIDTLDELQKQQLSSREGGTA